MKSILAGGALVATVAIAGSLSAQIDPGEARPMAGEYRTNISFLSLDMPGAPPQMADMMGRMMSRTITYCLTEDEIEEGFQAFTDRSTRDSQDCEYERYSYSGGEIDAVMVCRVDGRDMRMEMSGTGTATSSDITMTMSGDFGMGDGTMKMRAQHERIGECS